MKKIRAAIIGYGNIGKNVLKALQEAPDFEVVGVVRRSSSLTHQAQELKDILVVESITQLEQVDVAILSLPNKGESLPHHKYHMKS